MGKPLFTFKTPEGVEYTVKRRKPDKRMKCVGLCDDPTEKEPKIYISPYLTRQSELNTAVHEFAHAFFWDKTEEDIYKFANTLSRYLYTHRGWRIPRKKKHAQVSLKNHK
jgi:alpha-galactosidase/6-phospho-beta-glucosidase family protein